MYVRFGARNSNSKPSRTVISSTCQSIHVYKLSNVCLLRKAFDVTLSNGSGISLDFIKNHAILNLAHAPFRSPLAIGNIFLFQTPRFSILLLCDSLSSMGEPVVQPPPIRLWLSVLYTVFLRLLPCEATLLSRVAFLPGACVSPSTTVQLQSSSATMKMRCGHVAALRGEVQETPLSHLKSQPAS